MISKRIGIIGAGPAGLAALKTALEAAEYRRGEWADPVVLEAREDVGGVWLPAPASFPKPTGPAESQSPPLKPYFSSRSQPHYPPTPLYDSLTTNLPHPVMAFSSLPFPPSTPLFPKASIVHSYIAAYADQVLNANDPRRLRDYVKTGRRLTSVSWAGKAHLGSSPDGGLGAWEVEAEVQETSESSQCEQYVFDLLLICTGHYSTPNYPSEGEMPGLGAWLKAGRAAHAVWYRNAESIPLPDQDDKINVGVDGRVEGVYEKAVADTQTSGQIPQLQAQHIYQSSSVGTENTIPDPSNTPKSGDGRLGRATVLIVGSGPSGTDISADLVRAGVRRVIIASSTAPPTAPTASTPSDSSPINTSHVAQSAPVVITRPLPLHLHVRGTQPTGRVTFGDGTEEERVASVVLATGYQVDFPFFDQRAPPLETGDSAARFKLPKGVLPTPFWTDDGECGSGDTDRRNAKLLTNSNICVFPLARHLFPLPGFDCGANVNGETSKGGSVSHPTSLAFLGLNVRVAPLPLVEAQARAALSAFVYCYSPQRPRTYTPDVSGPGNSKEDLDWKKEERDIRERWDKLTAQYKGSGAMRGLSQGREDDELTKKKFIAKNWHRLPEAEQFAYRDELDVFAFGLTRPAYPPGNEGPHKTREWEARFYLQKEVLRAAWRALEARGDGSAEEWVRGVGSGKTGRRKKGDPGGGGGEVMNGEEEWVDMMERLVVWWETEGKDEDGLCSARNV